MATQGPTPRKNWIDDSAAWKVLFSSFINTRAKQTEYSVSIDAKNITVTTTNILLELTFKETFESSKSARRSLNYTLQEAVGQKLTELSPPENPVIDFSTLDASILKRFFSEELLVDLKLTDKVLKDADNKSDHTLLVPIAKGHGQAQLWEGRVQLLKAAILSAGNTGLSAAYLEDKLIGESTSEVNPEAQLSEHFKNLFGIKTKADGSKAFEFQYGALVKLLFPQPPTIQVTKANNQSIITFKRDELVPFLSQTFLEGFVLNYQGSDASLTCLPPKTFPLLKPKHLYTLVLDRSGSMAEVFETFIDKVEKLALEIAKEGSAGDIIRIVDFSDKKAFVDIQLTANMSENERAIKNCLASIRRKGADGNTSLYTTCMEELENFTNYPDYAHTAVIFTDGENSVAYRNADSSNINDVFFRDFKAKTTGHGNMEAVPSVFTIGLGKNYNKPLFEKWSKETGVPHTEVKMEQTSLQGFEKVMDHIEKMRQPRKLIEVLQGLARHMVSLYPSTLTHLDSPFDPSKLFCVNRRQFQSALIPPAPTPMDVTQSTVGFTPLYVSGHEANLGNAPAAVATLDQDLGKKCSL